MVIIIYNNNLGYFLYQPHVDTSSMYTAHVEGDLFILKGKTVNDTESLSGLDGSVSKLDSTV